VAQRCVDREAEEHQHLDEARDWVFQRLLFDDPASAHFAVEDEVTASLPKAQRA
jgi:hypothetical protein